MPPTPQDGPDAAPPDEPARPETIRVLYVDDEPAVRETTADLLERESDPIAVTTEASAPEGLERLQGDEERIDCVVSDYDMAEMDGLAFLAALQERGIDVPFILYTGKGSETIASRAISAGVTDYLQKQGGTDHYALLANRIVNAVRQEQAERVAATAERRLARLAENTTDVLWMVDADWSTVLFVNSAYEEVFQQSRATLREDPAAFLETVHPADRGAVERAMDRLSGGSAVDLEFRVGAEDGPRRWVRVQGQPVHEDGTVTAVTGFARDVTGRTEREQTLETFREAVESAGHSIYWTDERGVIEYVNPAFEEITGYAAEEAVGRTPRILKSGVHDEEYYADLWDTITDGAVWEAEIVNERKTGERYVVDQTIAPILTDAGDPERYVAVNTEITRRREHERTLGALSDTRAAVRTAATPTGVCERLVAGIEAVPRFDVGGVFVEQGDDLVVVAASTALSVAVGGVVGEDTVVAETHRTGEPSLVRDARAGDVVGPASTCRSALAVPAGERAVVLAGASDAGALEEAEWRVLDLFAGLGARQLRKLAEADTRPSA